MTLGRKYWAYGVTCELPYEQIIVLDDIVDSVIREAERSAEVSALTVGMVAGGAACYALLGVWGDMVLPGVGTVACSAVAGAAGHNRAKAAAKRTRSRFLNAILSDGGATTNGQQRPNHRNAFIDYMSAPSLDAKQRIAGSVPPAVFFADFYSAVSPLLRQVPGLEPDATEVAFGTAA
ncbi:hypothetical protein GPECTOR_8g344 [Gonium pectorale]|uniref:Uncharacterized protein n=1 Tax=Gonium pectorale TaxID=33097 RepID=A0A150GTC5_GONPE|nr:hypothetical protein GPECTOR_8g344 [Gonium pectorale]|eukprot:KXZ52972.1 hypothetical protein GPECTOR_8g344 [Gonium pectorale]